LNEFRRLFVIESNLSLFDVSARIFVDVVVVVVVFLLDLDRAARTGCVIKAK